MRVRCVYFLLIFVLVSTSVFAVSMDDVLTVLNYIDSLPEDADLHFEELESGQVKVYFDDADDIDIYYSTDGSTEFLTKYYTPIIVDIGTKIRWTTRYLDSGEFTGTNLTIKRNEDPTLHIENNAQLGTLIILEDDDFFSNPPIYYSIIEASEFSPVGQYQLKTTLDWNEFTVPIALADIPYESFVIAYVIPATQFELSSNVLYQEFKTTKGACFNYVFLR